MLSDRKVLCGIHNASADWYDPMWYAHGQAIELQTFMLLLDRNVYSLITQLADGDARACTDRHRLAAAVLSFAHCCDLRTESVIAVLEHELDSGDSRFAVEHPKFLRVLAADPRRLTDFALGRCPTLAVPGGPTSPPAELPALSEADRPSAWRLNYGCALKLASLVLDDGFTGDADRILAYLHWCFDEFFFSAGPTVYGALAISPRRKKGMFKHLRGKDVETAMHGIRNATWDMTLLSEWEERMRKEFANKRYYLICSFDQAIMDVAVEMMSQEPDARERLKQLRDRFILNWGDGAGDKLFSAYETMRRTVDEDPRRPANQALPPSHWDAKINELETKVKNAVAERGGS